MAAILPRYQLMCYSLDWTIVAIVFIAVDNISHHKIINPTSRTYLENLIDNIRHRTVQTSL